MIEFTPALMAKLEIQTLVLPLTVCAGVAIALAGVAALITIIGVVVWAIVSGSTLSATSSLADAAGPPHGAESSIALGIEAAIHTAIPLAQPRVIDAGSELAILLIAAFLHGALAVYAAPTPRGRIGHTLASHRTGSIGSTDIGHHVFLAHIVNRTL
jgi:hypothetical protein